MQVDVEGNTKAAEEVAQMAGRIKRGKTYYAVYRVGCVEKRRSHKTDSYRLTKDKVCQIESAFLRGSDIPMGIL